MSRMMFRWLAAVVLVMGCDVEDDLPPSNQPKDLPAPWVLTTGYESSMSSRTNDASGNRVFSRMSGDFGGLLRNVVQEYSLPLAVNPKEMMDWTLTGDFKGKNQAEVLADIAQQCQLTVGKTSAGVTLLSFSGRETQELLIPVDVPTAEGEEEVEE